MKIEFIKRGAATRLILIFAGWSTDPRYYNDCVADGWDTAVVSDYRDLSMPELPSQYSTIYIFAYSLGVWAAAHCDIDAAARIAICGSECPVSDEYGIPESIYDATAAGFTAESLKKFHLRMAGDRIAFKRLETILPAVPDIEGLRDELYAIARFNERGGSVCRWDKVYIAVHDRIFPADNLRRYWGRRKDTVKVEIDAPHAVDLSKIIKEVIPDPVAIGKGFSAATDSYNCSAVVQAEVCGRMGEIISQILKDRPSGIRSVLEIGVGQGLFTKVWSGLLTPDSATFVDLISMPEFGISENDEYLVNDAEEWLKNTSDSFDFILSASTIQWFADPIGFIQTVKNHLNPGGFAVISTFVKGNLRELDDIRPCPLIYHSAEEYKEIPDIHTEDWERKIAFSSSREMLMHLRQTGVSPHRNSNTVTLTSLPTELTYRPLILIIK